MREYIVRPERSISGRTQCSWLDATLGRGYPEMIFYYRERLDGAKLRRSLARVLSDFPLFAGRLLRHGPTLCIEHADAGARFECEDSDASIQALELAGRTGETAALGQRGFLARLRKAPRLLLDVKHTLTPDGSALHVVWSHAVGDLHSAMLLMRAWACAYADLPYGKPLLVPDRDAYLREHMPDPPTARAGVRRLPWSEFAYSRLPYGPATQLTSLEFSAQQLRSIREAASRSRPVTANDALCAHVFASLRRLAGATEPSNLCVTINYRKRIGIPDAMVGNMVSLLAQPMDEGDEIADVAAALRGRIEHFASKHVDYHANRRVFEAPAARHERMRLAYRYVARGRHDMIVSNWSNFGVYDITFGDARPSLFCHPSGNAPASLPRWYMLTFDLPASRGLVARVYLPSSLKQRVESAAGRALLFPEPTALPTAATRDARDAGQV